MRTRDRQLWIVLGALFLSAGCSLVMLGYSNPTIPTWHVKGELDLKPLPPPQSLVPGVADTELGTAQVGLPAKID